MQMSFSTFKKVCAAVVFMTTAVAVVPAQAQQRLSLSERITRLEDQAIGQGSAQGSIELVNQIQALQSQVQALQGQVEELRHQVEQSKRVANDQYIDLDSRIGRLEGGSASTAAAPATQLRDDELQDIQLGTPVVVEPDTSRPATAAPSVESPTSTLPSSASTGDPASEKRSYDEAFAALKDGRYAESARRFQAFTEQYPSSDLTGNAYYWLGESYYVTQNYRVALDTFKVLLNSFPNSQKAPDALLKTGYCQYELKQWDDAERTLTDVTVKYKDTTVARLAEGRLRALKLENRR